jgi:hypothetical protein
MSDDGLGPIDMTGRWVGFYRYPLERLGTFPITAEFHQQGDRIIGEMYDQITVRSELLDTIIEFQRESLSLGHRLRLEKLIDQFGDGNVVIDSRLPETSDIDGTVVGSQVAFTKFYRGPMEFHWRAGLKELGTLRRADHKVYYAGRLDREKGFVVGEWTICRKGWLGRFLPPEGRGIFELYRKS